MCQTELRSVELESVDQESQSSYSEDGDRSFEME